MRHISLIFIIITRIPHEFGNRNNEVNETFRLTTLWCPPWTHNGITSYFMLFLTIVINNTTGGSGIEHLVGITTKIPFSVLITDIHSKDLDWYRNTIEG